MNRNAKGFKVISLVLCAVVFAYLIYNAFAFTYSPLDTVRLNAKSNFNSTIAFDGFIVRDEARISQTASGAVIPMVKDGKRVAKGDAIAVVCNNTEDAAAYKELETARTVLERYISLSNNAGMQELDAEKLNMEIAAAYKDMMTEISAGTYENLEENINAFAEKSATKQILTDGSVDLSTQIAALEARIQTLEQQQLSYVPVVAPGSGYYINTVDGYESTVHYDDVMTMTAAQIKAAVDAKPAAVSESAFGKIVNSYRWYVIGVAAKEKAVDFPNGKQVKVNFPESGIKNVIMDVENVLTQGDEVQIVLSCDLMNETYANMRMETVEVITESGSGFQIPVDAVRFDSDNQAGVFVLRGKIVSFIPVNVLHADDENAVIESASENGKKLKLYDDVIITGKGLVDGKVIR